MKTTKTSCNPLCCKQTIRQILSIVFAISVFVTVMISPVYAASIQDADFYKGLVNLLNDLMTVAMILCPIVGGLAAIFCLIRRSMADEQDGKMWTKRIVTAIICGVAGSLVTGIIALITSYVSA